MAYNLILGFAAMKMVLSWIWW